MTNAFPSGAPGVPGLSMPTGTSGHIPGRRTSYASVVSGASGSYGQTGGMRSGAFSSYMNHPNDFAFENGGRRRGHSWLGNQDFRDPDRDHGGFGSWPSSGQLPSYSSNYQSLIAGPDGYRSSADGFFVPSYLKDSTYMRRLEEAHRSKPPPSADHTSSHHGSLSTSASSAIVNSKMAASHRGMTYDLIEKAPPLTSDNLAPLPSKWNASDKHANVEVLSDGLEVKYMGSRASEREHEAYSVRADHPMPSQCGLYYYEVTILTRKREESSVSIGFSGRDVSLSRPPGWEPDSWAYHGDDGNIFCCQSSGKPYAEPFATNDTIGCGINFRTGEGFFTRNGKYLGSSPASRFKACQVVCYDFTRSVKLAIIAHFAESWICCSGPEVNFTQFRCGYKLFISHMLHVQSRLDYDTAFREIKGRFFPSIGMRRSGEHVRVNFGQSPFVFDVDAMFKEEELRAREKITRASTIKLAPPLDETSLIQSLVLQYLSHDGYVETARAFASEVQQERDALRVDSSSIIPLKSFSNVREDEDAVNRQRIRSAVLDGDVDKALKHTIAYYPNVFKDNELLSFQLRCRKFIEMVRRSAEAREREVAKNRDSNGDNALYDDDVAQHMDLDDGENGFDHMDTTDSEGKQTFGNLDALESEVILYGQELRADFGEDTRVDIQRTMTECFSIVGYNDPLHAEEVSYLFKRERRQEVAEQLNSAILVSLGKSSSAALERLIQQTSVLIEDLREGTSKDAIFVNLDQYVKPRDHNPASIL